MEAEALTRPLDACPDAETLAAYLDGRLTQDEREHVTQHVADCDTCYFVVTESAQTPAPAAMQRDQVSESMARRWWVSKPVVWSSSVARVSIAGALATAASLWFAVGTGLLPRFASNSPALAPLVAAVGTVRTIEPRLSGGFAYGPLRGTVRAGESTAPSVSPDLRIAVAESEKAAMARRTPEVLQLLGVAYLVTGEIDRAIPLLEQAVEGQAPHARMLSDLAAAYLVRATRDNRQQDVAKALAAADRAVKADPSLAEALFNRAIALDRLALADEAREAWEEYLGVDDQSGWATEARTHLQALK
jgi:hypothetical protein